MKWSAGLVLVAGIVVFVIGGEQVGATNVDWIVDARLVSSRASSGPRDDTKGCSGVILPITIAATGSVAACVFGEHNQLRLARYSDAAGRFVYAVSFPEQTQFIRVSGLCEGLSWCVYGADDDTLLMQHWIYGSRYSHIRLPAFSSLLKKETHPFPHYVVQYPDVLPVVMAGTNLVATGPVALSSNGKWAVLELMEYGFARMNMESGEIRRVAPALWRYGQGSDPFHELAVSDDGRWMAVMGWRAGIDVYAVDGGCGDFITESSDKMLAAGSLSCPMYSPERDVLFPGFRSAHQPRFSSDGRFLSFSVVDTGGWKEAVLGSGVNVQASTPYYFAFGDSFVSGEGERDDRYYQVGTNGPAHRCHVSIRSYPYLLHPILTAQPDSLACSGARTDAIYSQIEKASSQPRSPAVVSVGVGGNDIAVMDKLKTCLGLTTCEWALPERRWQIADEIEAIMPKLAGVYSQLRKAYPSAEAIAVGYPKIINQDADARCGIINGMLLNPQERRFANEVVSRLNAVIAAAARFSGVRYVDVSDALVGERLCDESERAMNGIRFGDDIAPIAAFPMLTIIGAESFHPTPEGHALIAAAIRRQLSNTSEIFPCAQCAASPQATPYWAEGNGESLRTRLIRTDFLVHDEVGEGSEVQFRFSDNSFKPGSEVIIAVHSTPRIVWSGEADSEGTLEGSFTIPSGVSGYHTVHAAGESAAGEAIDRYQVIYSAPQENIAVAPALPHAAAPPVVAEMVRPASVSVAMAAGQAVSPFGQAVQGAATALQPTPLDSGVTKDEIRSAEPVSSTQWWVVLGLLGVGVAIALIAFMIGRRQV